MSYCTTIPGEVACHEKWDIMVKMRNFKIILVMRAGQQEQKQNA
jgi:hypothetical protein